MALKPNVAKLRLGSVIMAVLALYLSTDLYLQAHGRKMNLVIVLVGYCFTILYLYLAAAMPRLLSRSRAKPTGVILLSAVWLILLFWLTPEGLGGLKNLASYIMIGAVVVAWYLARNVRRLAAGAPAAESPAKPVATS